MNVLANTNSRKIVVLTAQNPSEFSLFKVSIDFVCLAFINLSILDLSGAIFKKNIFENLWWNASAVNVLTVNRKNSIPEGADT